MKEQVLGMAKEHLRRIAEQVDYSNLADMEKDFTRIFVILYSTRDLLELRPVAESVQEEVLLTEEDMEDFNMAVTAMEMDEKEEDFAKLLEESEKTAYTFERKIRGGIVQGLDAFVPEKKIHELDLHDGDLLYATKIKEVANGPDHYEYELVERGPGLPPKGIVEIKYAIVEYYPASESGFAVTRTAGGDDIRLDGEKLVLHLSEDDANMFKLQEDEVIDVAFYENNPENPKVRWRHSVSELKQIDTPRPSGYYKKKQDGQTEQVEQIFKGKTVCCMGYEPGWADFRDEVEKRGGEFIGVTGRESRDSLGGTLKKSDCLIMTLGHVGHGGTQWAVPFCKNNGIPYTSIKTFGRSTFALAADRLINH